MQHLIIAITGASGAIYGKRLLDFLADIAHPVHLTISDHAQVIIARELGFVLDPDDPFGDDNGFIKGDESIVRYHHFSDISAPIASGTHQTKGMVIVPCSINTLAAVANGTAGNLIERAASVTLKEGRKLVVVPRETPLDAIQLENMLKLSRAGACVLPAMPAFYHGPKTIDDQVDFIVCKILDQFGIEHNLIKRWE